MKVICNECKTEFKTKFARWVDDSTVKCQNPKCNAEVVIPQQTPSGQAKVLDVLLGESPDNKV